MGLEAVERLEVVKLRVVAVVEAEEERVGWVLDEFQWATASANGSLDFERRLERSHGMERGVEAD